jgi:hypothetical protein
MYTFYFVRLDPETTKQTAQSKTKFILFEKTGCGTLGAAPGRPKPKQNAILF